MLAIAPQIEGVDPMSNSLWKPLQRRNNLPEHREVIVGAALTGNETIVQRKTTFSINLKRASDATNLKKARSCPASRPSHHDLPILPDLLLMRRITDRGHAAKTPRKPAYNLATPTARTLHARIK